MPSGGTGLSKVGAFVVLQGAVGFEAFELGITETSGETGVGLYDCALKSSSWISPLSQLFGTVLLSSLNNDEFRVIVRPSPWTVIMLPFLRMTVFSRIICSRTFRRFERSPRNTLSARLTSQGLTSGHLLSAWVLILSFCDEPCLRAISATGLALLTCGSLLRTADSYPVAI